MAKNAAATALAHGRWAAMSEEARRAATRPALEARLKKQALARARKARKKKRIKRLL